MTLETSTITTPIGPLTLIASDGVLRAASFTDQPAEVHARLEPTARQEEPRRTDDLGPITDALRAYFDGEVGAIDSLPVEQAGSTWFQSAWKVMREVPAGSTISYRELATRVGDAGNARVAGFACARNQIVLVVPCHRIVRSGGSLGDYYYGLDVKSWLLRHEGVDVGLPFEGDPPAAMAGAAARQAARSRQRTHPLRTMAPGPASGVMAPSHWGPSRGAEAWRARMECRRRSPRRSQCAKPDGSFRTGWFAQGRR